VSPPLSKSLRAPVSWVVYDLANTIYSAVVVTFLINPYVEGILHAVTYAAVANFVSMVLAGLVAPTFGEMTDHAGTSKRWLVITTLVCCLASVAMTASHLLLAPIPAVIGVLICFGVANFCYQLALVFYNSLLPGLVPEKRIGTWSGIGVGVGYFGTTVGMLTMLGLTALFKAVGLEEPAVWGFAAAGVLFFLMSVPLFLWVPERSATTGAVNAPESLGAAMRHSVDIWRRNLKGKTSRNFLLGNLFLTDVLNTTIFVFAIYCVKVFDEVARVTDPELPKALIALSLSSFVLGIACGGLSDKIGAKRALLLSGLSLGVALAVGVLLPPDGFWFMVALISSFGAFGLAGIWTAGRALLIQIAPKDRVGEFFGMYGLTLKVSVVGSILFGLLADHLPFDVATNYRWALGSGFVSLFLGLFFISRLELPEKPEEPGEPEA